MQSGQRKSTRKKFLFGQRKDEEVEAGRSGKKKIADGYDGCATMRIGTTHHPLQRPNQ